jgi:hypothetical protein
MAYNFRCPRYSEGVRRALQKISLARDPAFMSGTNTCFAPDAIRIN